MIFREGLKVTSPFGKRTKKKEKQFAGAIFIDQKYRDQGFGIGVVWNEPSMKGHLVFKVGSIPLKFKLKPGVVVMVKTMLEDVNKPKGRKQ
jgi:hypothetical protein